MFSMMQNSPFMDAYQSWFASLRDQATVQLMSVTTLQHQLQSDMAKTLEENVSLLDLQMPGAQPDQPAKQAAETTASAAP